MATPDKEYPSSRPDEAALPVVPRCYPDRWVYSFASLDIATASSAGVREAFWLRAQPTIWGVESSTVGTQDREEVEPRLDLLNDGFHDRQIQDYLVSRAHATATQATACVAHWLAHYEDRLLGAAFLEFWQPKLSRHWKPGSNA